VKRYFKREFTPDMNMGEGAVYVEFDGEWATRQVDRYQGRWYSADDPKDYHPGLGMGLTDQPLSKIDLGSEHEISAEEFDRVWAEAKREQQ
jgi:hypothetical protein